MCRRSGNAPRRWLCAAFNRYRHELEKIGIESAAAFRRIIHSAQSLECEARKRALYAMQLRGKGEGEGEGKKETCTSRCGIIAHMKNTRNAALDPSANIRFFSALPSDVQERLESKSDPNEWTWRDARRGGW